MSKFEAGDRVRCINNKDGGAPDLVEGVVYKVTNSFDDQVILADVDGSGWWDERFVLASDEKFLEDAYDTSHYQYPETKYIPTNTATKSVHQLAAETFSALSGKPLSDNDVKIIVELVEVMEKL